MFDNGTEKKITQLRREKRYDAMMVLCEQWIEAMEKAGSATSTKPFDEAAKFHHQEKRYAEEASILERYAKIGSAGSKMGRALMYERLPQAYVLAGLAEERMVDEQPVIYHIASNTPVLDMPLFWDTGLFVDTETTGFGRKDELIEIACILFKVSRNSGRIMILDEYQGLRQPSCPIPEEATAVHGLRMADVKGKCIDEAKVRSMLAQASFLVAHNASYDRQFVSSQMREFGRATWYCSMNGVGWRSKGLKSKGLDNLAARHQIDRSRGHRAMDDAHAALALLGKCDEQTGDPYVLEMLRKGPVDFEEIRRLAAERKRRPKSEAPEPFRHVVQIEVGTPKRSGLWGTLKRLFGGIG